MVQVAGGGRGVHPVLLAALTIGGGDRLGIEATVRGGVGHLLGGVLGGHSEVVGGVRGVGRTLAFEGIEGTGTG